MRPSKERKENWRQRRPKKGEKKERKMEKKAALETIKSSASRVLLWQWVSPCVFNYKNAIENWKQNVFSVSITHHSEIRELSDGNKNQTDFSTMGPTIFELWVIEIINPNNPLYCRVNFKALPSNPFLHGPKNIVECLICGPFKILSCAIIFLRQYWYQKLIIY